MKPESISAHESHISMSMEEAKKLGKWALINGEIDAAVTLLGTAAVMEEMQNQEGMEAVIQEAVEPEVAATEQEGSKQTASFGSWAANSFNRFRERRPRGVRRPVEYQDPRYHYGNRH